MYLVTSSLPPDIQWETDMSVKKKKIVISIWLPHYEKWGMFLDYKYLILEGLHHAINSHYGAESFVWTW